MILRCMAHPERIIPDETTPGIVAVHLKRYSFARPYCSRQRVLDAACGVGYGSAYLAETSNAVLGVDVSKDALAYADAHYAAPNVEFAEMDVTALDLPDDSFDVVVSFETIEHVAKPASAVEEAARVLRPDGTYVVSTPKAAHTTLTPANPFHMVELSVDDFAAILRERFAHVELFGQRRLQTKRHQLLQRLDFLGLRRRVGIGLVSAASTFTGTPSTTSASLDDIVIDDDLDAAIDLVAVCRAPR
jgi:SAM-dependent methyltransferase